MKKILIWNIKGGTGKSTFAWALAQVLSNANIVDLDNQKTLTNIASIMKHEDMVVAHGKSRADYVIYDCPPYRDASLKGFLKEADYIIVPVCVGIPDLLATKGVVEELRSMRLQDKSWVVFNRVRKPLNTTYKKIKAWFATNYTDVKRAKTEISELRGFRDVFFAKLAGKAYKEMANLAQELEIKTM